MTTDEVAKLLSENNLVGTYANGLRDYSTTGILSSEYVKSMAEATGFYKIVDAEKQLINGNPTGMIWLTEISRVLVPEEMYQEQLSQEC